MGPNFSYTYSFYSALKPAICLYITLNRSFMFWHLPGEETAQNSISAVFLNNSNCATASRVCATRWQEQSSLFLDPNLI